MKPREALIFMLSPQPIGVAKSPKSPTSPQSPEPDKTRLRTNHLTVHNWSPMTGSPVRAPNEDQPSTDGREISPPALSTASTESAIGSLTYTPSMCTVERMTKSSSTLHRRLNI